MERLVSIRIDYFPDRDQGPQYRVQPIRDDGFGKVIHNDAEVAEFENMTSVAECVVALLRPEKTDPPESLENPDNYRGPDGVLGNDFDDKGW